MDFIIFMMLAIVTLSSNFIFYYFIFLLRKEIQDIQQSANYIYNNHDKVNYIYRIVKQARKERVEKTK